MGPTRGNEGSRPPPPSLPGRFQVSDFIRSSSVFGPLASDLRLIPPFVRAIHGRLGDVVFKTHGDKIVITRVPCFDGYVPTVAQRTQRDRMRAATAYAQRVYADPVAKTFYLAAAVRLGRNAFRLAISDYLAGRVLHPAATVPREYTPASPVNSHRATGTQKPDQTRHERSKFQKKEWCSSPIAFISSTRWKRWAALTTSQSSGAVRRSAASDSSSTSQPT